MCDKCIEIDEKIEHYRELASSVSDQRTSEGVAELIADLQAQKDTLHPKQEK
jgi:hypothetical protein